MCKDYQKIIECRSCHRDVHHNTRNNSSGLTNSEFASLDQDHSKYLPHLTKTIVNSVNVITVDQNLFLSFSALDGMQTKETSDDINIISVDGRKFASLCEHIQNFVNSENGDDILLNHVNSKYYDVKPLNSTNID